MYTTRKQTYFMWDYWLIMKEGQSWPIGYMATEADALAVVEALNKKTTFLVKTWQVRLVERTYSVQASSPEEFKGSLPVTEKVHCQEELISEVK